MKTLKKNLDKILYGCAALLGLVAILLMFAPAAVFNLVEVHTPYTGAQLAFGYKNDLDITLFSASANIVAYILFAVGIVAAVVALLGKFGKIPCFVAAACFLIAGILSFCVVPLSSTQIDKAYFTLGAGAVCSGIFGILAAVACAANLVIKPKK